MRAKDESARLGLPAFEVLGAGLDCSTVPATAWPVLRTGLDAAVAVTDKAVSRAAADLTALGVCSGPCGAASLAGVRATLSDSARRAGLQLPADPVLVLRSTEGNAR